MKHNNETEFSENYFIGKLSPQIKKSSIQAMIRLYPIQLVIFVLLVLLSIFLFGKNKRNQADTMELEKLKSAPLLFARDLGAAAEGLFSLREEPFIQNYLDTPDEKNLKELGEQLLFYSKAKKIYNQVRILDEHGFEKIRVNRDEWSFSIVPENELQDKSERYYFQPLSELPQNHLYFSPLDLNMERGVIQEPKMLTIRLGVALFDSAGKRMGSLIFNVNMNHILLNIEDLFKEENDTVLVLNSEGEYILHSNGLRDLSTSFKFKEDYPSIYDSVCNSDESWFYFEDERVIFYRFNLADLIHGFDEYPGEPIESGSKGSADDHLLMTVVRISKPGGIEHYFTSVETYVYIILFFIQVCIFFFFNYYLRVFYIKKIYGQWLDAFFQGVENNPASILLTDKEGEIIYSNKTFLELTGYNPEEVYRENPRVLKSGFSNDKVYEELWNTISRGMIWSGEFHNKKKDGRLFWVNASISPIYTGGEISGYLGIQEDISENKELRSQLEELASTDPLTGLLNRRAFLSKMDIEIERATRNGSVFSVLMIDLDHFKKVNDSYGHLAGDCILESISALLKKESRMIDIVSRYGGEELIMVLPETDREHARVIAERLRVSISALKCDSDKGPFSVTVSIGIAQWDRQESLNVLIGRADTNLYKAKDYGRNRVV